MTKQLIWHVIIFVHQEDRSRIRCHVCHVPVARKQSASFCFSPLLKKTDSLETSGIEISYRNHTWVYRLWQEKVKKIGPVCVHIEFLRDRRIPRRASQGGWNVPLIPWKFNFFSLISSSYPHSAGWPKERQRGSSILTGLLRPSRWCSNRSRWCCSSSSAVLRHVVFGLRLFRFPSGVQCTAA